MDSERNDIAALDALYAGLLRDLRDREVPAAHINAAIAQVLALEDGPAAGDPVPDYAGDLVAAMGLMPVGTWFNWNHFGFQVVPNRPMGGGAWSNAVDHYAEDGHREGAPVAYEASGYDSPETRAALPRLVCTAVMMARRAAVLKERARREGRHHVVQTGQGPLVATPEGRLAEIPSGSYLTADGRLVPHDERLHGGARVEEPDA